MAWYDNVFELIDMRSFSNLWYWIALAVMWSSASHFVLGVPFDLVGRARRHGGQAEQDLEDIVRVNVNRRLYVARAAGLWLVGLGAAFFTTLGLLGFLYRIEFAQALFLLLLPMSFVALMGLSVAHRIRAERIGGEDLCRLLARHRFWIQVLGMIAIFITAMWGMWQNMHLGVLRG